VSGFWETEFFFHSKSMKFFFLGTQIAPPPPKKKIKNKKIRGE